ncbi:hypothetical protein G7L40_20830 [Paenibacillus polymyxa]|uniref:hypothetical protein n=1 Tax=Paenibacillus polymyxa TaxID=1406 RepID=UPI0011C047E9|nr:hypothetical protein [Paenibacillus polymyxa]MBE7896061.1 hypothetical protein [Paenibacillus polymyxa]MCC3256598.1 hypothetical protein [Paenibacillus polymyxa]QPK54916.1 hypothetical protein G7035_20885 [Paenibacillus polymyxa]QPK60004.1 hypothetical protein G7L40_20830 [Paenibacillus polymyxa]WEK65511.1 hypothetical protein ERJ71_14445 [Paenibacillus polymyxa]
MNRKQLLTFTINLLTIMTACGLVGAIYGLIYPQTTTPWFWFGFSGVCLLGVVLDYLDYRKLK